MSPFSVFHGFSSACVHLSGKDALTYLRSQLTNSIPIPDEKQVFYSLWLNENGRVLADSYGFVQSEDSCLIWSYYTPIESLMNTIQKNIVADEVELTDVTSDFEFTILHPSEAGNELMRKTLQSAGFTHSSDSSIVEGDDFFVIGGSPLGKDDIAFIAEPAFHKKLHSALNQEISNLKILNLESDAFEFARISNGVTAVPKDLGHRNLPQEGRFRDPVIDYHKGCFPGQEIMARFRKSGKLNKRIRVFDIECNKTITSDNYDIPSNIYSGKTAGGTLSSIATHEDRTLGLGLLKERFIDKSLHIIGKNGTVTPVTLIET